MARSTKSLLEEVSAQDLGTWDAKPFLEKIVGIVPSIIYVFNQQTQSNEYANHSLGEAMGYSAEELQAMGAAFMPSVCHPDDLPRIAAHFTELQHMKDGAVSTLEYRMKHKDGGWIWLLSHDTIFDRDQHGRVLRHIGVAADITAQKAAEEAALAGKNTAIAANDELRSFAYSISHDLKSPSNTLDLLLTELQEHHAGNLKDDGKDLLKLCIDNVHRMQQLIEDVLNHAHVVAECERFEATALGDVLQEVVLDLQHEIRAGKATLDIQPLPTVAGNATQLRILFQNLLSNALKYRRCDVDPVISLTGTVDDADEFAIIQVSDNGIGISAENHERIFLVFKRLHLYDEYRGTGLGLATCRRIALAHGGNISVQSATGKGSTFEVRLKIHG